MNRRLFFCALLIVGILQSQDSDTDDAPSDAHQNRWQMFSYDMGNIFLGIGHAYSRPLHWKGEQWRNFGLTLAGTGVAYLFDDAVSDAFRDIREDVPEFIRTYGAEYGSPTYNYMLTGAVYFTALGFKDEKLRRTGVLLISSATAAGFLQQVLKSAVGRARPLSEKNKDTYRPFWSGGKDFHSFPSGHAILAMTNAHAIAKQFRSPWVKAGIYTLGGIPAISRLWEGKHWLSDVVFSVAVSIFMVESIDRYLDSKYDQKYLENAKKVSWNLNIGIGQIGVTGRF
ncbi:MAG: phosphatase PAP2 family protein [Bacteroidota bacterium]